MSLRNAIRVVLVAMFFGACAAVGAPAATAHPANVDLWCESGGGMYRCSVTFSGAHDPVTIRWYRDTTYIPEFDNMRSLYRPCSVGVHYRFTAVVTDVHGSGQDTAGFTCRAIWQ